jgi:predicted AAA+ superfamily ATPase
MQRLLNNELVQWKNRDVRMPILLDGARQVGKTYLIEVIFGQTHFKKIIKLDFLAEPGLCEIFSESKNTSHLLRKIQLAKGVDFDPEQDLLFFDEIGECQDAVDSLKFFQEQRPDIYLCASGSNIGLLNRFPVGKVQILHLYPMTFEEFVLAQNEPLLIDMFRNAERNNVIHKRLWELLLDYYYVGGMPRAVDAWVTGDKTQIVQLTTQIRNIHLDLITGYIRDFGKYARYPSESLQIERVFNNIPMQLMKEMDGSVNRFQFSHVIPRKKGYQELSSAIGFLLKIKLASQNFIIEGAARSPLKAQIKESRFKLFFFDVGILHTMLEITYKEIVQQKFEFKGFIAENFVQNEALAYGFSHTYSWVSGRNAELEFIFKRDDGEIIPIEVKSGSRKKAKSLRYYIDTYAPKTAYKLTAVIGGFRDQTIQTLPLYYAKSVLQQFASGTTRHPE